MILQYFLSFSAGGLSLLAPCVIPLIPLVISSFLRNSKFGAFIAAAGMCFTFTVLGILGSVFSSFFAPDIIRKTGALFMILMGLLFIYPQFKDKFFKSLATFANKSSQLSQHNFVKIKYLGEFLEGSLLGFVWSPCTGPTLAIAIAMASQSKDLVHSSLIFFFFALGASTFLLLFAFLLKKFSFFQNIFIKTGAFLNKIIGFILIIFGILILSGVEAQLEELILEILPNWIIDLSVRF